MALIKLSCISCGAPLQVASTAEFVTCGHCHSQLAVKHSESAHWTEQLGQIDRRTQQLSEQVAKLHYQQAVERLDREWEARPEVQERRKHGLPIDGSMEEDSFSNWILAAIGLVLGVLTIAFLGWIGAAIVVAIAVVLIVSLSIGRSMDDDFLRLRSSYLKSRNSIHWRHFLPDAESPAADQVARRSTSDAFETAFAVGASMTLMHASQEADAAQAAMLAQQHATSEVVPASNIDHGSFSMESVLPSGSISATDFAPAMPSMEIAPPSMPSFDVSAPMPDISGSMSFGCGGGGEM